MAADLRQAIVRPRGGFVHYPKDQTATEPNDKVAAHRPQRRRLNKKKIVAITCGVLAFLMLAGFALIYYLRIHGTIVMPSLIGLSQADAVSTVQNLGVQDVTVVNAYSDDFAAGQVMLQSRGEGERVTDDATITLTVSLGSQWYELEDLTGRDASEAIAALAAAGVSDVQLEYMQSDLPNGTVVSQSEAAGRASRDTAIVLQVSGQSVPVPSLIGLTLEGAQAVIEAEGLNLGTVTEGESADAASGTVIAQSVTPYTQVLLGTAVNLTICKQQQETGYAPQTALTVNVPLDNVTVEVIITAPSGQAQTVVSEKMSMGTHSVSLTDSEAGIHKVDICIDGVLWESMNLDFE